jgi:protein involved in polysaccharide export with SLBB domain
VILARWAAVLLVACLSITGAVVARGQTEVPESTEDLEATPGETRPTTARSSAIEADRLRVRPPIVQSGPIDPARYLLGPGDILELGLWGRVSRNILLTVSPEGTVFLPGAGPLAVSGQNLEWARQRILERVGRTFRGVNAEVRLVQLRTFKVYLSGLVRQPGAIEATSATRASEVLTSVGIVEGGSRRNIEVRRLDGTRLRVDLELFQRLGRQDQDPILADGDVLHVPTAVHFGGVYGAVERPARLELAPRDSLSTLLRLGGGPLPSAAPERAHMVRFTSPSQRESLAVDLDALQSGRFDLVLQDGDQLFVQYRADYHLLPTVSLYGEIEHPGTYPIVLGRDRFSDLILRSGGFRPLANRAAIHLVRESGVTAQRDPEFDRLVRLARSEMTESEYVKFQTMLAERKNSFRVDWSRIQQESQDVDPLLLANDIIRVEQLVPTVRVEGEVRRPGLVDHVSGRSLKEYVELAGGFTDRAARRDIRISRSLTGQVIPARNMASVQPGDFIWVPERKDVDAWAVFRDAIAILGQVAVVVFTLSR